MIVRNYRGKLIKFDIKEYTNEVDMYKALWKIKYNITIDKKKVDTNEKLKNYINGDINFI